MACHSIYRNTNQSKMFHNNYEFLSHLQRNPNRKSFQLSPYVKFRLENWQELFDFVPDEY